MHRCYEDLLKCDLIALAIMISDYIQSLSGDKSGPLLMLAEEVMHRCHACRQGQIDEMQIDGATGLSAVSLNADYSLDMTYKVLVDKIYALLDSM